MTFKVVIETFFIKGMVLQRHERGDCMITDKGYRLLKGIVDMYLTPDHDEPGL